LGFDVKSVLRENNKIGNTKMGGHTTV